MRIHIDDNVVYLTVGNTYSLINKRENKPFATLEILAEDELRIVFYTIDGKVAHADRPGIGVEENQKTKSQVDKVIINGEVYVKAIPCTTGTSHRSSDGTDIPF